MPPCEALTTTAPLASASAMRVMLSATAIGAGEAGIAGLEKKFRRDCVGAPVRCKRALEVSERRRPGEGRNPLLRRKSGGRVGSGLRWDDGFDRRSRPTISALGV